MIFTGFLHILRKNYSFENEISKIALLLDTWSFKNSMNNLKLLNFNLELEDYKVSDIILKDAI